MEKHFSVQQKLFYAQLLINSILILIFSMLQNQVTGLFYWVVELLAIILLFQHHSSILARINKIIQVLIQPLIIPASYSYLVIMTHTMFNWTNWIFIILTITYSLLMFIPYTYLFIVPIRSTVMRVVIIIFSFLYTASGALDLMVMKTSLNAVPVIQTLSSTLFDGAMIIVVIILVSMNSWGYGFPEFHLNRDSNYLLVSLLILFSIWFAFWNAFSGSTNFLSSLYTFQIKNLSFTSSNILSGLEAGLAEEFIFRFGILTILIEALYNSRNKFIFASLISSFLFGILHGINALAGQDINNTIIQIIFAFSFGFYLSAIYLYTNCFYLTVLFHVLIDTLVFLGSNDVVMAGKVSFANLIGTTLEGAVFILIGFLLIKRAQAINHQFDKYYLY